MYWAGNHTEALYFKSMHCTPASTDAQDVK